MKSAVHRWEITVLVVVLFVTDADAAWFRIRGPTVITSGIAIGSNYDLITVQDTNFTGSGAYLDIRISTIVANIGRNPIRVTLCNVGLLNGATLYFTGGSGYTAANSVEMTVTMMGLYVNNGGVGFRNEMPFGSSIAISSPVFVLGATGGTAYSQWGSPSGSYRPGVLFYNTVFHGGSFLLYGPPLDITSPANTFDGSNSASVASILFSGAISMTDACMFHLFQLSSANGLPIYSIAGTSVTLYGGSVFYLDQMVVTYCQTTCVRIDYIYLRTSSIFLFDKGAFQGATDGFQFFGGNSDSTNCYFGITGCNFDVAGYALYNPNRNGPATWSGSGNGYMGVYGNYYRNGWSFSISNCYMMCNSYPSGPANMGGCNYYDCTADTLCYNSGGYRYAHCYAYGASVTCNPVPTCTCSSGAYRTALCIPFTPPRNPASCLHSTRSLSPSSSVTMTMFDTESRSFSEGQTSSVTTTNFDSVTDSSTATTSHSSTDDVSASFSNSWQWSKSVTNSLRSETYNQSRSFNASVSNASHTLTTSWTPFLSRSASVTRSDTIDSSMTRTVTVTPTLLLTPSDSPSETETYTLTPSQSKSPTTTSSWCEWFTLDVTAVPPVRFVNGTNDTFTVHYLDFRDDGGSFIFDDLGQWWIKNFSFQGFTSNLTLFTFNNETVTLPKVTDADYRAFNPTRVGVQMHGFSPDQFYNSELDRTVTIGVTFRCAVVNFTYYWFMVIEPYSAPMPAAAAEIFMRTAILSSVLLATPYGSSIAALALNLQQLYLCQPLSETTQYDITGWSLGDDDRSKMRGAIVGNVLIVVGQLVVMLLIIPPALKWNMRIADITVAQDFWRLLRVMQLPTSLHITVSAVLQLIVAASVSLFRMSNDAGDIVLGVFGMLLGVGYTALIWFRAVRIYQERRGVFNREVLALPIRLLPREEDQFLYGEYDKPWYAGFETMVFLLIGIISGSPPETPYDCTAQYGAILFISLVSLGFLFKYSPFRSREGQAAACLLRVLTIVMAACCYVMTRSRPNQIRAMQGASVCLILITIFAVIRALMDLRRAYYGIPWLVRAIFRLKEPEPIPKPDVMPEPDDFPAAEEICPSSESEEEVFVPQENLRSTDVIGFLGHAKDEIEEIDDLLVAYRGKKKRLDHQRRASRKELDFEKILAGEAPVESAEAPSSSTSSDDDDVRRLVKKGPINLESVEDGDDSDADDDHRRSEGRPNPFQQFSGGGGSRYSPI